MSSSSSSFFVFPLAAVSLAVFTSSIFSWLLDTGVRMRRGADAVLMAGFFGFRLVVVLVVVVAEVVLCVDDADAGRNLDDVDGEKDEEDVAGDGDGSVCRVVVDFEVEAAVAAVGVGAAEVELKERLESERN